MRKLANPKQSVWQLINPVVSKSLVEIHTWLNESSAEDFALSHFRIENIASVLFSYGHNFSLKTIDKIPEVLSKKFNGSAKVIRIGIEDIILIFPIKNKEDAISKLDQALVKLRTFGTEAKRNPMFIKFQVGTTFLSKKDDLESKFDETYIALFEAFSNPNKRHVIFDNLSEKLCDFKESMILAAEFQNIINDRKLRLAFQPVVHSSNGKVKSYEVLLRIIGDDGELKSAGRHIGIAEDFGFIDQVDMLVLELAVKELELDENVCLGMNVSSLSVDNLQWLEKAKKLLHDPDLASRLIVEITETGLQSDLEVTRKFVDEIQSLGCQVAIDDFGAGYTSFSQLKVLNADIMKIDGIFIRDLIDNYDNQLFVKTLVEFAKAFGLKTVAEYVENGEIAKILIDMEVDYLQGHYFGKALNHRPWIDDDRKV